MFISAHDIHIDLISVRSIPRNTDIRVSMGGWGRGGEGRKRKRECRLDAKKLFRMKKKSCTNNICHGFILNVGIPDNKTSPRIRVCTDEYFFLFIFIFICYFQSNNFTFRGE